ncbi:hypothetical protein AC249_AIPGENE19550 [Exaiptasia diaphana]|nr:hypothetical protein AC249_AIPGENE19550 [Exaiptasia diaphana]
MKKQTLLFKYETHVVISSEEDSSDESIAKNRKNDYFYDHVCVDVSDCDDKDLPQEQSTDNKWKSVEENDFDEIKEAHAIYSEDGWGCDVSDSDDKELVLVIMILKNNFENAGL